MLYMTLGESLTSLGYALLEGYSCSVRYFV